MQDYLSICRRWNWIVIDPDIRDVWRSRLELEGRVGSGEAWGDSYILRDASDND